MYLNVLRISYDNEWKVQEEDDKERRVPQLIVPTVIKIR